MVTVGPVSREKVGTVGFERGWGLREKERDVCSCLGAPEFVIPLEEPDSLCPAL